MTTVAVVIDQEKNNIYFSCDTRTTCGNRKEFVNNIHEFDKILQIKNFYFLVSGNLNIINLIKTFLSEETRLVYNPNISLIEHKKEIEYRFDLLNNIHNIETAQYFVDCFYDHLIDKGFVLENEPEKDNYSRNFIDFEIIMICNGKAFCFDSACRDVYKINKYSVLGSGSEQVYGLASYLYDTVKDKSKILKIVMKYANKLDIFTNDKFIFKTIKLDNTE